MEKKKNKNKNKPDVNNWDKIFSSDRQLKLTSCVEAHIIHDMFS